MTESEYAPPGVDVTRPSPARMYDYFLGGTHNYAADRAAADRLIAQLRDPADAADGAWASRAFHQRAARWMADECGIRQFIDIGSGLPTQNNTHDAVRMHAPDARVAYVDNDPAVAAYASELLAGAKGTVLITADLRDPDALLGHGDLCRLIDFGQPAGLLMTGVLHFVADASDPWGLVRRYLGALAPGSYLALSNATADRQLPGAVQGVRDAYASATAHMHLRTRAEVERFFDGLELVPPYAGAEPGIGYVGVWGAEDPEAADIEGSRAVYCGVARKP